MSTPGNGFWQQQIGSQIVELPLVQIRDDLTIALMMTIDMGVAFNAIAGRELAAALAEFEPEIVVSAATLGIPVAIEVSRAFGFDDYVILQKTNKWHLRDSPSVQLTSITSQHRQRLILDSSRAAALRGKRVVFVDDVISTGGSAVAALRLLEQEGIDVVGVGALLAEGDAWCGALGAYAARVRVLGDLPTFSSPEDAAQRSARR